MSITMVVHDLRNHLQPILFWSSQVEELDAKANINREIKDITALLIYLEDKLEVGED